jgi:hypothetical protein
MRRLFAPRDFRRVGVEADVLHHRDERMPVRIEVEIAAAADVDEPEPYAAKLAQEPFHA